MAEGKESLSVRERGAIYVQGALMAIPYVGPSLERFISGPATELRYKRFERTLTEIAERLGPEAAPEAMVNEDFVNLLESVAPELSRASNETKRKLFRDLLTNAARIPKGSEDWEEAALASKLISEMDAPGLAIIAGVHACRNGGEVTLTSRPVSQVFCGDFDFENPGEPQHILPFQWVVVEYWARWLRERRIIHYMSHDARGGFGRVTLGDLGEFLIKWGTTDD